MVVHAYNQHNCHINTNVNAHPVSQKKTTLTYKINNTKKSIQLLLWTLIMVISLKDTLVCANGKIGSV